MKPSIVMALVALVLLLAGCAPGDDIPPGQYIGSETHTFILVMKNDGKYPYIRVRAKHGNMLSPRIRGEGGGKWKCRSEIKALRVGQELVLAVDKYRMNAGPTVSQIQPLRCKG